MPDEGQNEPLLKKLMRRPRELEEKFTGGDLPPNAPRGNKRRLNRLAQVWLIRKTRNPIGHSMIHRLRTPTHI